MEIEKKFIIRWWREDKKEISADDRPELESAAEEQVYEGWRNNNTCGELVANFTDEPYRGWWEYSEKVIK